MVHRIISLSNESVFILTVWRDVSSATTMPSTYRVNPYSHMSSSSAAAAAPGGGGVVVVVVVVVKVTICQLPSETERVELVVSLLNRMVVPSTRVMSASIPPS
jgi:hypothetical protein